MANSGVVRLRAWQKDALDLLPTDGADDFLAVATPGAGKTTFALVAAARAVSARPRPVVVVAPTLHLKQQWAGAAERFGLHLDPRWSSSDGALPPDSHGVVVTYQQVAAGPQAVAGAARGAFVVLDEVHHAAADRSWGDALAVAVDGARGRLSLSGTPFRSDDNAIPFVCYDAGGQARADYEYGYGAALADGGVVRPVYFPRVDGRMEWSDNEGLRHDHAFSDPVGRRIANQRLRAALTVEGEWLRFVLGLAHERLLRVRANDPTAGGLVVAMDQDHARGVAGVLRSAHGARVTVAVSDDPAASDKISRYAASADEWVVAVRMVSEGVDVPRLRVAVFATNTTTELFFRQAVGRVVRWRGKEPSERAYVFIPDDYRLRAHARSMAETRRHVIERRTGPPPAGPAGQPGPADRAGQTSLFEVFSAVATGTAEPDGPADDFDRRAGAWTDPRPQAGYDIELPVPPTPSGRAASPAGRRKLLRAWNAEKASEVARITRTTHAEANRYLNQRAGVGKVSEATAEQLERRLRAADDVLARAARRPPDG